MFDNPNQKNKVVDIAGPEKMRETIEFAPPVSGENKSFQELSDLVRACLRGGWAGAPLHAQRRRCSLRGIFAPAMSAGQPFLPLINR